MNFDALRFDRVLGALGIPPGARVDLRVPKRLLAERGAPTAADKRRIMDGIEELHWVAALKPTNIGVPAFRDAAREYLEIQLLTAAIREGARTPRLMELIHRAIPYPVLLVSVREGAMSLSVAHKRWSQSEGGKVVLEELRQIPLGAGTPSAEEEAFLKSMAVSRLPARNLFALYGGWIERLTALEAAWITGVFRLPESPEYAVAVRAGLSVHARLKRDLSTLKANADREKQINRRVELNTEIKRLEAELAATEETL